MGFLDNLVKSIIDNAMVKGGHKTSSSLFKFQEEGEEPARDSKNRVIVKVQTGESIELDSYVKDNSDQVAKALLGKPEMDKWVEDKSVRLRMFKSLNNSDLVELETVRGDFVGFVRKADTPMALNIIDTLTTQIEQLVPGIGDLVFDVGAKVSGTYDEDEDENGKAILSPTFDSLIIKVRDSAEIEIHSEH